MPVEERELLRPVGGVVRGIEIDRDLAGPAPPALVVSVDHAQGQLVPHLIERLAADAIFEPRNRRLRAADGATLSVPITGPLEGTTLRGDGWSASLNSGWVAR
jgi:hypothetical protein